MNPDAVLKINEELVDVYPPYGYLDSKNMKIYVSSEDLPIIAHEMVHYRIRANKKYSRFIKVEEGIAYLVEFSLWERSPIPMETIVKGLTRREVLEGLVKMFYWRSLEYVDLLVRHKWSVFDVLDNVLIQLSRHLIINEVKPDEVLRFLNGKLRAELHPLPPGRLEWKFIECNCADDSVDFDEAPYIITNALGEILEIMAETEDYDPRREYIRYNIEKLEEVTSKILQRKSKTPKSNLATNIS